MAKARLTGFDNLESFLGKLAKPEAMAIKAVNTAAPVLEKSLKAEVKNAANRTDENGNPYSTGELERSISTTKARENAFGVFAAVRPTGTDEKGTRNAEKMAYLEYGTSRGQLAHPVRQKAINTAEAECEQIMKKVIYEEIEKL